MKRISILLLVFCTCFALAAWPQAQPKHKIITFEDPNAGTGTNQGTWAWSLNSKSDIVGDYIDSNGVLHGFLRDPYGNFTTIDAPDAGTGSGQGTFALDINSEGEITGDYLDSNSVWHGYLLADGSFTPIDAPGAGTGARQGTLPQAINRAGLISGAYVDSNNAYHGFVRSSDGTITKFDDQHAGKGSGQGTAMNTWGLNSEGAITGWYLDSNNVYHGYLRAPDGKMTDFDIKGVRKAYHTGTLPMGLNSNGWIAGQYCNPIACHGFVRDPKGTITKFFAKGASSIYAWAINSAGTISGFYFDKHTVSHGYVRDSDGTITTFDFPGAGPGWDNNDGPVTDINDEGVVTGCYPNTKRVERSFVWK